MEQTNILNSVDKLDFILNETLFNKYNRQCTIMQKFINDLNNNVYNDNKDFIKCPEYILNEKNCIETITLNLKTMINKFNNYRLNNNKELENILKKINTVNLLISVGKINSKNFHIITDFMKTIEDDIDTFIIHNEYNSLMQFINNGKDETEFLLNYIDENY